MPVGFGLRTLKEAVDAAFEAYMNEYEDAIYCIGSVVGPHPFPMMVRDFQTVIGIEAREQFYEMTGHHPDAVCACVGGGSNSIGMFVPFVADPVEIYGVEPLGRGPKIGDHAASMTYGSEGIMHGFNSIMLQDEQGQPQPVYSVASGLDYPSVGPEHALLHVRAESNMSRLPMMRRWRPSSCSAVSRASFPLSKAPMHWPMPSKWLEKGGQVLFWSIFPAVADKDIDYVEEHYGCGDN